MKNFILLILPIFFIFSPALAFASAPTYSDFPFSQCAGMMNFPSDPGHVYTCNQVTDPFFATTGWEFKIEKIASSSSSIGSILWATSTIDRGWTGMQPSDIMTMQAAMVTILECWAAGLVSLIVIALLWGVVRKIWTH
jgi:hypothetical protein